MTAAQAAPAAGVPVRGGPRRARLRAATEREIKDTARQLLVEHGAEGLSLRAIARGMGMTAPALYRYFPSREDLLEHLVADLYEEVCAALAVARDAVPAEDVGGAVLAVSRTFRRWALDHPGEFGLLFGSPVGTTGPAGPDGSAGPDRSGGSDGSDGSGGSGGSAEDERGRRGPAYEASLQFALLFGELVARLFERRPFPVPADEDLEPGLAAQLREWADDLPLRLPLGALQVFLSCWIRLYGAVCVEVFGHLRFAVADAGGIFEAELRSLAGLLGAADLYRPPAGDGDRPVR